MAALSSRCGHYIFATMKLCSRLFVLYCRSRPKDDKSRHFNPHFEEVRGGIEPWWMARWKARAEFLLSVVEILSLSLTAEALQGSPFLPIQDAKTRQKLPAHVVQCVRHSDAMCSRA